VSNLIIQIKIRPKKRTVNAEVLASRNISDAQTHFHSLLCTWGKLVGFEGRGAGEYIWGCCGELEYCVSRFGERRWCWIGYGAGCVCIASVRVPFLFSNKPHLINASGVFGSISLYFSCLHRYNINPRQSHCSSPLPLHIYEQFTL